MWRRRTFALAQGDALAEHWRGRKACRAARPPRNLTCEGKGVGRGAMSNAFSMRLPAADGKKGWGKLQVHAGEYERGTGRVRGAGVLSSWGIARPAPPSPPTSLLPLRGDGALSLHHEDERRWQGRRSTGPWAGRGEGGRGGQDERSDLAARRGTCAGGGLGRSAHPCSRLRARARNKTSRSKASGTGVLRAASVYNVETGFAVESRSTPVLSSL